MVLEKAVSERYLVYRVQDGFARGGVFVFDIARHEDRLCLLSLYVAFDFPRGSGLLTKVAWHLFRLCFPAFPHDVAWNHALCKLKDVVEEDEQFLLEPRREPENGPAKTGIPTLSCERAGKGPGQTEEHNSNISSGGENR